MDISAQAQRIPPHSLEAEQSVLGSMLLDKEAVAAAAEVLQGEDFYSDAHKEIYEAILDIYDRGEPVDLVTLAEELRQGAPWKQQAAEPTYPIWPWPCPVRPMWDTIYGLWREIHSPQTDFCIQ